MRAFISYSGADRKQADAAKQAIERLGCDVWLAPVNMEGKPSFQKQISDAICDSDHFVILCSEHSATSQWVERELTHALANSKPIIPLHIAKFSSRGWLSLLLGPLDWIDARNGYDQAARAKLKSRLGRRNPLGKVITTLNLKGGVGKTTLTANMGAEAHFVKGASVLYLDLDPQYNLTQYFLGEPQIEMLRDSGRTVLSLFELIGAHASGIEKYRDYLFSLLNRDGSPPAAGSHLDVLAGHDDLFAYTIDEKTKDEQQFALANLAAFIDLCKSTYDLILVDVNPSASFLTKCALSIADHVVAPVRPERYAINGLKLLQRLLRRVKFRDFGSAEISIIINQLSGRLGAATKDIEAQTRQTINASPFWQPSLAPDTVPYSVTLQPSALNVASERPVDMIARYSSAPPQLLYALNSCVDFVYQRAGVRYARSDSRST